tara:strand:+ start:632 stop:1120 length:489 start_codon:yes stop_codon:yes gene_type:complete
MHPMDINWYFDHDEINDLQIRAINSTSSSVATESRWLKMNRELFARAIISQNPRVEYYNIVLKDPLGTEIPVDHPIMDNEDFASNNQRGSVESQELYYHCMPSNFSWSDMIDHEIEAILSCDISVSPDGSYQTRFRIDLQISLEAIENMGWGKFSTFMDSFN